MNLLVVKRFVVGIGCATLVSIHSLHKLIILRHKIIIGWISLRTVTISLLLFSNDIFIVFQQLAGLLFSGGLGASV